MRIVCKHQLISGGHTPSRDRQVRRSASGNMDTCEDK